MAKHYALNFTFFLLLFGIFTSVSLALYNRNNLYDEYGLESRIICNPQPSTKIFGKFGEILNALGKKHEIKLSNTKGSALIVRANISSVQWNGFRSDKYCKFYIQANKGDSLFGVIQKLSFRHNGTQCLDYVQFKSADHRTKQFCGQIDQNSVNYFPNSETAESSEESKSSSLEVPAEFDEKGLIETTIFISKEALLPEQTLNISIVYTPYKDCQNVKSDSYKKVISTSDTEKCMLKGFICDGLQNCAPNMCSDEADCYITSTGTGTKVTLGAVTTIFLCFIISVMCLWICKKNKKMCWSADCAGPDPCSERPTVMTIERQTTASVSVPSAPMLEVAESPVGADKDLPPSYESLFPEQSNPTTS